MDEIPSEGVGNVNERWRTCGICSFCSMDPPLYTNFHKHYKYAQELDARCTGPEIVLPTLKMKNIHELFFWKNFKTTRFKFIQIFWCACSCVRVIMKIQVLARTWTYQNNTTIYFYVKKKRFFLHKLQIICYLHTLNLTYL